MAQSTTSKSRSRSRPAVKPWAQLSPATKRRIESYAARMGVSVEEVRASQELTQAARGHRQRPGSPGESVQRRRKEAVQAQRGEWTSYRRRAAKAWFERQGYDWGVWKPQVEAMGWENWTRLREYQRQMYQGWVEAGRPHQPTWTGLDWSAWERIIDERFGLEGFQFFYHTLY